MPLQPRSSDPRPPLAAAPRHRALVRALLVAGLGLLPGLLPVPGALPARTAWALPGWRAPLAGPLVVVRGFAPPPVPWAAGHRGVDLAGSDGEQVLAAGDGRVGFAGRVGGLPVAVVASGALRTTYEPVVAVVAVGRAVRAGEVIGTLVTAGSHCAPGACLHWGLLRGTAYLDPLALLGEPVVRLLPQTGPVTLGPVAPAPRRALVADRPAGCGGPVVEQLLLASPGPRRAGCAAAGPPWCASGRCGSR
ncbi:M23 family metallopeptidase [Motilibacter rhizosphaerae]|uniref:M23 family metallopeptidase n=1 Tax=Motilibacter rhizosphaerae TaxID=598652 RepID=UPI001E57D275|nr:M23 family metallopeptidase [Motilibacter rhizosphaerae]